MECTLYLIDEGLLEPYTEPQIEQTLSSLFLSKGLIPSSHLFEPQSGDVVSNLPWKLEVFELFARRVLKGLSDIHRRTTQITIFMLLSVNVDGEEQGIPFFFCSCDTKKNT